MDWRSRTLASKLPQFPSDALAPLRQLAASHVGGSVDLSIGTPVDDTPRVVREALEAASNSPGYPRTIGTAALREAGAAWFADRRRATIAPEAIAPVVGTKEVVAWLPTMLGLGPGDVVARPVVAYPTYEVGATLCGAQCRTWRSATDIDALKPALVWVNSPSNPTGAVLSRQEMADVVAAARRVGAVVASDECYAELPWSEDHVTSALDDDVTSGDHSGILVVHSVSKSGSMAGYRAGILAGDAPLVADIIEVRKHSGLLMPAPVQAALTVALSDRAHVQEQKERYQRRLGVLRPAVEASGLMLEPGGAGLYLWGSSGVDCWETAQSFAQRGIVVNPGSFYGEAGTRHVRVSLTASDEDIREAARRLS